MKKLTGKEWKQFYHDDSFWRKGVWFEEEMLTVNGEEQEDLDMDEVEDDDIVRISGGVVHFPEEEKEDLSFEVFISRWQKMQRTERFVVTVDKERSASLKELIKANHGKIE